MKIYYVASSQVLGVIIQQIYVSFLTDKVLKGFDNGLLTVMNYLDKRANTEAAAHSCSLE